jgi:hypothetical protein
MSIIATGACGRAARKSAKCLVGVGGGGERLDQRRRHDILEDFLSTYRTSVAMPAHA